MASAVDVTGKIYECLKNKRNFLLSGGAGSGKTYTLIQTLHSIYVDNPHSRVACITYTNVAANEIKSRSPYSKLWVSTIHDFLWGVIKGYQKNLIRAVRDLILSDRITYSGETPKDHLVFTTVEYRNYRSLEDGIISHDDLLKVAEYMFEHNPLLSKILCDKFEYVLIDEYQDTQKPVINIFLKHIQSKAVGKTCLGFFGDKMQSIYESGIVDIQTYIDEGLVTEIKKNDNYRCAQSVISLLNNLRFDISQQPAKKNKNGIVQNKIGKAIFLYSKIDFDLSVFQASQYGCDWDYSNPLETKLLFLTHRLIARRDGWDGLLTSWSNNDMLLGDNPDRLASHLRKIGGVIFFFRERKYDQAVALLNRRIRSIKDKKDIGAFLSEISDKADLMTIEAAINAFNEKRLLRKDDKLEEYFENHTDRMERIKSLPLSQVLAYYAYYNDHSPYSTQHGIKGAEFENVLVVLDNGNWNNYNFKSLFEKTGRETVIQRTERIFYVCCSRAINNLVVFFANPSPAIIASAKKMFGEDNVIEADK